MNGAGGAAEKPTSNEINRGLFWSANIDLLSIVTRNRHLYRPLQ
jgi:hypothetical protein